MSADEAPLTVDLAHESGFRLGGMEVRPSTREVLSQERHDVLQPRVMQVLVALARRRGEVVSRDELIASCWGGRVVGGDAIDRCINLIRGVAKTHCGFSVQTVARVGYRLSADDPVQPGGAEAASPPATPSQGPRPPLLAFLAFDNLSGDPEMAYFSDGVSEEILQTVARGADLKVIGRASSFQFRGAEKAARRVAAALNATHILDGSVRRSGSRVRISAQLIECDGETTIWSGSYERELLDVFAVQDEIATSVAAALEQVFTPQRRGRIDPETDAESPLDPSTYEVFLRARGLITEGSRLFDEIAPEATPLLDEVVKAAPHYAPAWELLALSRAWTLRSVHQQIPYAEGRAGVLEAAETTLRLDPKRGGAYSALALLEPWGAYAARERLLEQALHAAPNEPGALTEMATFCWSVGRFRDALRFAEQACEINPLMPASRLHVAEMRTYVGDYDASIRMHQDLHRRWPRNYAILMSLLNFAAGLGFWDAYDEAVGAIETFEGWQAADLRATKKYAEALRSGDPSLGAKRLRRYADLLDKTGALPLNLVEALSQFGMVEEALSLAERASYAHIFDPDGPPPSGYFPGAVMGPWSALNKTPRFINLADRLGLCAYWRQTDNWPDCVDWAPYDFKAACRAVAGSATH